MRCAAFRLALACVLLTNTMAFAQTAPFLVQSTELHRVRLIDDGVADLELRLRMIDGARERIDYQTYLLRKDFVGRVILRALAAKKSRDPGVRVRLLVDAFGDSFSAVLSAADEAALASAGVELRYYNPKSGGLPVFWPVGRHNHRNHCKILTVDAREALIGGRNTAEEYFGLSQSYNYVDRDAWLEGPVAMAPAAAFDAYWNDASWVKAPKASAHIDAKSAADAAAFLIGGDAALEAKLLGVRHEGAARLDAIGALETSDVTFVQDRPGHAGQADRVVTPVVHAALAAAGTRVAFEENDMALSDEKASIVLGAIARGVSVSALTNSYASSDSLDVATISRKAELRIAKAGASVSHVTGRPPGGVVPFDAAAAAAVWGVHTKSIVVDGMAFVGSYNADSRSEEINNESLLVFRDERVARALEDSISTRSGGAHLLKPDGTYADGTDARLHVSLGRRLTNWLRGPMAVGTFLGIGRSGD